MDPKGNFCSVCLRPNRAGATSCAACGALLRHTGAPPTPQQQRFTRAVVVVTALLCIGVMGVCVILRQPRKTAPQSLPISSPTLQSQTSQPQRDTFATSLEQVKQAVVFIEVSRPFGRGQASGFVIRSDGYILTNAHVVENLRDDASGQSLRVVTNSGTPSARIWNAQIIKVGQVGIASRSTPSCMTSPCSKFQQRD
jgi:putative serine protease PepD